MSKLAIVATLVVVIGGCTATAAPGSEAPLVAAPGSEAPAATARVTPRPVGSRATLAPWTPSPRPAAILGEFEVGGFGWAMSEAAGALWIQVDPPVDAIVRLDTATGSSAAAVKGGRTSRSGDEGLWVGGPDWLVRIDPTTGEELLRVDMAGAFDLDAGAVWMLSEERLYRIDATSGAVGPPIGRVTEEACARMSSLVVAFGSVWLSCRATGGVVRMDPSTGATTSIKTAQGAHTFTVTDEAVWVTNYADGSVSRIDPRSNTATTVRGVGTGVGITSGGGFVWASTAEGIAKLDSTTGEILGVVDLGPGQYYELVWDDGVIWASTRTRLVLKVDPEL